MSFIYNWGHSWWPVGCCIPADVCGLEYRMPACTMSQRFCISCQHWNGRFHTHTHTCTDTHTHAYIFLLSLEKKKRFMNNETIFSPGNYLLMWSKSWPFSPAFHISLGQFFLVLSITYLSIVSVFWSVPDDIWCVPLSIWKKKIPLVYNIHTIKKIWIG